MSVALLASAGKGAAPKLYPEDVFSTYLYTGNGSTQTINNGIDLAGKGGMVWIKRRSSVANNYLMDNASGLGRLRNSNNTNSDLILSSISRSDVVFNSNGFTLPQLGELTDSATYASWTFRKAPKFFDIVTYTGNGVAGRQIPHNLGCEVGMLIIKATSMTAPWIVYHRSNGNTKYIFLNATNASATGSTYWNNTTPTDTVFTLGSEGDLNASGQTYVAYLYAHDTSADGIIQCGSFTTNPSSDTPVSIGWEPQYILIRHTGADHWRILDSNRGMVVGTGDATLKPNTSDAEVNGEDRLDPTATGFIYKNIGASLPYIYMAIRRPNKVPTSGTQVYNAVTYAGDGSTTTGQDVATTFPMDMAFTRYNRGGSGDWDIIDRLRGLSNVSGSSKYLNPHNTNSEGGGGYLWQVSQNLLKIYGFASDKVQCNHFFKRAKGFFDIVCYTGTGVARTVNHNLGVVPEMMWVKSRNVPNAWYIWFDFTPTTYRQMYLNYNYADGGDVTYSTAVPNQPSTSVFSLGTNSATNGNTNTHIAYLFATLAGVSKVGSYTGNGTSINLDMGFTSGCRFFMVKRTDSTGDWYIFDTVRGIVSANDPHLSLNTTAAEVTTDDSVDPYSLGITVNQVTATNINVNSASYIYLAIA